jgi:signal transduction histidine kinase
MPGYGPARYGAAVTALTRALARAGTTPADAGFAAGLTLLVGTELFGDLYANGLLAAPVVVPATASLAWRRRWPVGVAFAVCAMSYAVSVTAPKEFPPQLVLLAVIVAVYSMATETRGRRALLGATLTLPVVVAAHVVTREGRPDDYLPFLVWGASWFAGRVVQRRGDEAARVATEATLAAQRAEGEAVEAAARERDRIARELHDVVAHAVSLVVVQAGAERLALGSGAPRTVAVLDAIETAGRQALVELRSMLGVLRAPDDPGTVLLPQPGFAAIPALVVRVREAGMPVTLDLDVPDTVPAGVALSAYRIVQEALTNALKHAATASTVTVRRSANDVTVEVTNPLPAGAAGDTGGGRGLAGMRERALLHGGSLVAGADGGRWVVRAVLPLGATS